MENYLYTKPDGSTSYKRNSRLVYLNDVTINNGETETFDLSSVLFADTNNYLVFVDMINAGIYNFGIINTTYYNKVYNSLAGYGGINVSLNDTVLSIKNNTGYSFSTYIRILKV